MKYFKVYRPSIIHLQYAIFAKLIFTCIKSRLHVIGFLYVLLYPYFLYNKF